MNTPCAAARSAARVAHSASQSKSGDLHDAYANLLRAKAKLALQQTAQKKRAASTQASSSIETELSAMSKLFSADPYAALAVSPTANAKVVKKAYFKLARKYHPDKMGFNADEANAADAHVLFAQVSSAYDTLNDPTKRAQADRARRNAPKPPRPPPAQTQRSRPPPKPRPRPQPTYKAQSSSSRQQPPPQPPPSSRSSSNASWQRAANAGPRTAGPSSRGRPGARAPKPSEQAKAKARAASAAYKRTAAEKEKSAREDAARREAWRKQRWDKMKEDAAAEAARRSTERAAEAQSSEARAAKAAAQQEVREAEMRERSRAQRTANLKRTAAERAATERAAARERINRRRNRGAPPRAARDSSGMPPPPPRASGGESGRDAAARLRAEQAAARDRVEARAAARVAAARKKAATAAAAPSDRASEWKRTKQEIRSRGLRHETASGMQTDADDVFSRANAEKRSKAKKKKKKKKKKRKEENKKTKRKTKTGDVDVDDGDQDDEEEEADDENDSTNHHPNRTFADPGLVTIVYDARLDKEGAGVASRVFAKAGAASALSFQKRWCVLTSDGKLWSAKDRKLVWRAGSSDVEGNANLRASAPGPHCKLLLKLARNVTTVRLGAAPEEAGATVAEDAEHDDGLTFRIHVFGADGSIGVGHRTFRAPSRAERTKWIAQLCAAVDLEPPLDGVDERFDGHADDAEGSDADGDYHHDTAEEWSATAAEVEEQRKRTSEGVRAVAAAAAARVGSPRAAASAGRSAKQKGWAWWRKGKGRGGANDASASASASAAAAAGGGGVDDLEGGAEGEAEEEYGNEYGGEWGDDYAAGEYYDYAEGGEGEEGYAAYSGEGAGVEAEAEARVGGGAADDDDGTNWRYCVDEASGHAYWEHILTGESRWVVDGEAEGAAWSEGGGEGVAEAGEDIPITQKL